MTKSLIISLCLVLVLSVSMVSASWLSDLFSRDIYQGPPVIGWSDWYSKDNPGGTGDFEILKILRKINPGICEKPSAIECQTIKGVNYTQSGEKIVCSPEIGAVCINKYQKDGKCEDYKVRFYCESGPSNLTCEDSDGLNYNVKGETVAFNATLGKFVGIDYCANTTVSKANINGSIKVLTNCNGTYPDCFLMEFSCMDPGNGSNIHSTSHFSNYGNLWHAAVNCPNGCKDGACVVVNPTSCQCANTNITCYLP